VDFKFPNAQLTGYLSKVQDLIVAIHRNVKKGLLLVTLCGLLYVGAGLVESFFPYEWRHAIDQWFDRISLAAFMRPIQIWIWNLRWISGNIRRTG
jgi:hypothetical protein